MSVIISDRDPKPNNEKQIIYSTLVYDPITGRADLEPIDWCEDKISYIQRTLPLRNIINVYFRIKGIPAKIGIEELDFSGEYGVLHYHIQIK
jgi:hypothetical protein